MRFSILVAAALVALPFSASAQDRTLPAGAYMTTQPPIDTIDRANPRLDPTFEGRSIRETLPPKVPNRARHPF